MSNQQNPSRDMIRIIIGMIQFYEKAELSCPPLNAIMNQLTPCYDRQGQTNMGMGKLTDKIEKDRNPALCILLCLAEYPIGHKVKPKKFRDRFVQINLFRVYTSFMWNAKRH